MVDIKLKMVNSMMRNHNFAFMYPFAVAAFSSVMMFALYMLLPKSLLTGAAFINSIAHYAGYVFWVICSYHN